jgi:hypothetical protein
MRPRLGLAGLLVSVMLAGCDASGHADGNEETAAPSPTRTVWIPEAGACYPIVEAVSYQAGAMPLDCAKTHRAETVYVGSFAGAHAASVEPPAAGSPALRWAFDDCDARTKRFVGGDWRGARLSIQVVVESPESWADGSRWYRCDIFELDAPGGGNAREHPQDHSIQRTGSLRDAFKRRLPLVYTCFDDTELRNFVPVGCSKPHGYEFVGIWTAPDLAFKEVDRDEDRLFRGCYSVLARYLGVPKKTRVEDHVGATYFMPSPEAWQRGDRGVRCFLWSDGHRLTRSVKGGGLRALSTA